MISKRFLILLFFFGIALTVGFLVYKNQTKTVEAGAGQNVKGFAWSDIVGWISANSNNCDTNNDGLSEGVPPACPSSGTAIPSYGLDITDNGTTGIFSGYAWSEHAGWITFNQADLVGCPTLPCQAVVDKQTGIVSGWAKFLTTGDWLKLKGTNYGILINKGTGDFSGYGWGDTTAGLVSASCQNNNRCASNNYKLTTTFNMNVNPTISIALGQNPVLGNVCSNPSYSFFWTFYDADGDTQSKYRLQINKEGNFAAFGVGEVDLTVDPAIANSGELQTISNILLAVSPGSGPDNRQISYNTTYYWRVMVYDQWGGASPWANGTSFTTPAHLSPTPNFTWNPLTIVRDQEIQFCSMQQAGVCANNASVCYGASAPLCTGASFLWTFPSGTQFISGTNQTANPKVKFPTSGSNQPVTLQITDDLGPSGQCSITKNINVILPLPKYQEILPQ